MEDDIRPRGTVEVTCVECGWNFWLDSLDSRLPDGPFICPVCDGTAEYMPKNIYKFDEDPNDVS